MCASDHQSLETQGSEVGVRKNQEVMHRRAEPLCTQDNTAASEGKVINNE